MVFHLTSLILIMAPLFYWISLDPENVWPVLCALGLQTSLASTFLRRKLRVNHQLWLLVPTTLASFVVGAALSAWPSFNVADLPSKEFITLALLMVFSTLSTVLSIYSFPDDRD